ncbi:MAG: hypothetical protein QOF21_1631 [Actinomycetota bacterium]|jgi:beta-mannanase
MNPNNLPTTRRIRRWAGVVAFVATAAAVLGVAVIAQETPAGASRASFRRAARATTTTAPKNAVTTTTAAKLTQTTSAPTTAKPAVTSTTAVAKATTSTTVARAATPSAPGGVMFGAETEESGNTLTQLANFESHAGKKASLYGYYASFYYDADFDTAKASAISNRGTIPMLTWEPWQPNGVVNQPNYSLAKIAGGSFDAYLTRWANQIKTWNHPLWLRFAHEMNGDWYPWAEGLNGNSAGSYVAAWRHVHDVFANAGVTNVTWVWTPNVLIPGRPSFASLYPGDSYVDWVGLDGYNWGTSASWSGWQSPSDVMGTTLANLRQVSSRPIVIGETASTEVGGNKAQWIQQFFSMLAANPDVKAFLWFNLNKENDWRIESSPSAQAAFAAGVADSRFVSA